MGSRSDRKVTGHGGRRIRRVIRYSDCYVLEMRKKRRVDKWSVPTAKNQQRNLKAYAVPYVPVGGPSRGALPLTLVVEVEENWLGLVGFDGVRQGGASHGDRICESEAYHSFSSQEHGSPEGLTTRMRHAPA